MGEAVGVVHDVVGPLDELLYRFGRRIRPVGTERESERAIREPELERDSGPEPEQLEGRLCRRRGEEDIAKGERLGPARIAHVRGEHRLGRDGVRRVRLDGSFERELRCLRIPVRRLHLCQLYEELPLQPGRLGARRSLLQKQRCPSPISGAPRVHLERFPGLRRAWMDRHRPLVMNARELRIAIGRGEHFGDGHVDLRGRLGRRSEVRELCLVCGGRGPIAGVLRKAGELGEGPLVRWILVPDALPGASRPLHVPHLQLEELGNSGEERVLFAGRVRHSDAELEDPHEIRPRAHRLIAPLERGERLHVVRIHPHRLFEYLCGLLRDSRSAARAGPRGAPGSRPGRRPRPLRPPLVRGLPTRSPYRSCSRQNPFETLQRLHRARLESQSALEVFRRLGVLAKALLAELPEHEVHRPPLVPRRAMERPLKRLSLRVHEPFSP